MNENFCVKLKLLLCISSAFLSMHTNASQTVSDPSGIIQLHPESQSVTLNSTVRLQCRVRLLRDSVTGAGAQVYWSKNEFGIGGSREDIQEYGKNSRYPYSRYDLPYNLNEGEYDLQITNVELSDEGSYVCQVNFMKKQYLSQTAVLTVQVPSEAPKLIQVMNEGKGRELEIGATSPAVVDDGSILVLKCVARHGKPGAILTWSIDGVPVQAETDPVLKISMFRAGFTGNLTSSISPSNSLPRLKDSTSQITARLNKLHHGKLVECHATNPGYGQHSLRPAYTKLEVHYAPVVSIQVRPQRRDNEFMEHDIITVECSAHGRPDTFIWEWFVNGRQIEHIADPWYRLRLTRELHNAVFRCIAMSDKKGHAETTIKVRFGPQFVEPSPLLFTASPGESVSMDCPVRGNPEPRIDWRREDGQEVLHRGVTFRRDKLREEDFGTYTCTAITDDFPPVSKQMFIAKRRPPVIQPNPIVHAHVGRSARLRCTVNSVPLPPNDQKHWYFNGRPVRADSQHSFEREEFLGGVVLVLHVAHVMVTDFGKYNCTVRNGYGSDWTIIELVRQEDIPLQFIVGAAVAIGTLVITGLIFLCFCRQRFCTGKYAKGIRIQAHDTREPAGKMGDSLHTNSFNKEDFAYGGPVCSDTAPRLRSTHSWFTNPSQTPVTYLRCGSDLDDQHSGIHSPNSNGDKMNSHDFQVYSTSTLPSEIPAAHCQFVCNGGGYLSAVDPRLLESNNSTIFTTACPVILPNRNSNDQTPLTGYLTQSLQTASTYGMNTGQPCLFTAANGQVFNAVPQLTNYDFATGLPTHLLTSGYYPVDGASEHSSTGGNEIFFPNLKLDSNGMVSSPASSARDVSQFHHSSHSPRPSTEFVMHSDAHGVAYILKEHTTNV